jgi:hypothetical protein
MMTSVQSPSSIGQKQGEASCKKVKLNVPDDLHNRALA